MPYSVYPEQCEGLSENNYGMYQITTFSYIHVPNLLLVCILVSQREVIRVCVANADSTRFIEAHLPKIYFGN